MNDVLKERARKLWEILERRDQNEPIMNEAVTILIPMLKLALTTQVGLPEKLPKFIWGMHDWEFSARYLRDAELLNALGDFEDSLKEGLV